MTLERPERRRVEPTVLIPGLGKKRLGSDEFQRLVNSHPFAVQGTYRSPEGKREIVEKIEQINLNVGTYAILARGNGDWTQHDNAVIERAVLRALLSRTAD